MAGIISEGHLSRGFNVGITTSEFTLLYDVTNTEDESEVYTLLAGTSPSSFFGLRRENIDAEPIGGGVWKGSAHYVRPEDENEYTFDTGGGTKHMTQALDTINAYGVGGATPPNFQGAIGVTDDKVEGVDVPDPKFEFSETHLFDPAFVDAGYKRILFELTGSMNGATFKGMAAGECLFLGASGAKRGIAKWSITFRFSGSQNVTGLTIGAIGGVDKLGHDYAWIRYGNFVDAAAGAIVSRPVFVIVNRVLPVGDFSLLSIGT